MRKTSRLFVSKPTSTRRNSANVRANNPAPTSSITAAAISATTSPARSRPDALAETAVPSLSAPAIGVRLARKVGTAFPTAVTRSARTAANDATRAFMATSCRRGMPAGAIDRAASTHHAVRTMAMTIVTIALNTLSAINCRVTRLPPAPSARRIAISLARPTPRAMARLATLAQTSNSRQNIAAKTRRSSRRLVRAISSASGESRTLQPALMSGCSAANPLASVCIRAVCAFDGHPGFHPAHDAQEPGVARGPVRKARARYDTRHVPRRPKGRRRVGHHEVFGHDTNHAPVAAFYVDGPANDLRIGAQGLPEVMTQHDDRFAAGRLPRRDGRRAFVFVRMERAPKPWLTTIHVEETARDVHPGDRRAAVAVRGGWPRPSSWR